MVHFDATSILCCLNVDSILQLDFLGFRISSPCLFPKLVVFVACPRNRGASSNRYTGYVGMQS